LKANLIVNPIAGNRAYRSIKKIEALLRQKVSFTTQVTRKKGDAFAFARDITETDLVIVASGDGTFNEVINGMLSSKPEATSYPLALIPLGTSNVLAKELNIPGDIEKAVHLSLTGTPKKISLGRINGHYFSLMAGIGFDGETVLKANDIIKKMWGKGAYIFSGILVLKGYSPPLIQVKTPDGILTGYTAVVGKASYYGGPFQVTPGADITKPLLDLCLLKSKTKKSLLKFISGVITKRHMDLKDVIYRKFSKLEITSKDPVHVQIDGDYFGTLPVKIDAVQDVISIIW